VKSKVKSMLIIVYNLNFIPATLRMQR
jgi:hypothetical protein